MQGTILILDGVSTNRIMLKVQLSAAYYHVVQSDGLQGLLALARRCRPDLIVTAMSLPDGNALAVREVMQQDESLRHIPIIAVTAQNDPSARLTALAGGIDDVLAQPLDDLILQARIRSLIRARSGTEELHPRDSTPDTLGFAEPVASFEAPAQVALLTRDAATSSVWRARLKGLTRHRLQSHQMNNIHALMADPVPDAIVVDLTGAQPQQGLRLLADLRARSMTSHAALIAVVPAAAPHLAADALDRGAHDVLQCGFCPQELSLRLTSQLRRKASSDRLRASVRDGLRAAVRDPMTGLYNRRYALPHLAAIAGKAAETGSSFAVMLADLDHFKQINDAYGHQAGDAVLIETARRLKSQLRPIDMIARVGGEEFLIVMPNTDQAAATVTADRLCRQINALPFQCPGTSQPVHVTTSIGVVVGPPAGSDPRLTPDQFATALIGQADRALYGAKGSGRNRVSLIGAAA
ncbi:diguanylate cyclase [Sedimentitalea nanhaiensis]|uniref:diguanylate cyclase n=1 Tax=Sedimentitalea nanhaiensis TaxID=999627 RepID=A0A1I7DSE4_9RHOB|nr:diguanylate cyclase [Sedimentitalea nanhaiensis]SFU14572.1 response regulator receiver modulated diguanylate cyclase [Sedimentitalea nanhaiensis]